MKQLVAMFALALAAQGILSTPPTSAQDVALDPATITVLETDPRNRFRVYAGTAGWGLVVSADGGDTWSATTAQMAGKYVTDIALHAEFPGTMWVGTRSSGAWISFDGGANFQRLGPNLPDLHIAAVAVGVDPTQRAAGPVVYLLQRSSGLVRSSGEGWQRLVGGMGKYDDVWTDPSDARRVLLTRPNEEGPGLYLSDNAGLIFEDVRQGVPTGVVPPACAETPTRVVQHPARSDELWVTACLHLLRSTTGGSRWEKARTPEWGAVVDIAFDPEDPNSLIVSASQGIFRSLDGGVSWLFVRAASGVPLLAVTALPGGVLMAGGQGGEVVRAYLSGEVEVDRLRDLQATQRARERDARREALKSTAPYDRAGLAARPEAKPILRPGLDLHVADIAVHPNFSNVVFAGTRRGVFASDDGGATWRSSSLGLGEMEVSDLLVDASASLVEPGPKDPKGDRLMIWAATRGGGIYRSTSTGRAWQLLGGLPSDGVVRRLLQDETNPRLLWAATADNGVYRSTNAGEDWRRVWHHEYEFGIRAVVQGGGELVVATDGGYLLSSRDRGSNWRTTGRLYRPKADSSSVLEKFLALGLDTNGLHIHDLLVDRDDADRMVAASSFGVFLSEDGGRSWTWTKLRRSVARLARDPRDEDRLFAATTRGLWWSKDGGKNWQQTQFGKALNKLSPGGGELDPTKAIRLVPPIFSVEALPAGDVLIGTDRGHVLQGSAEFGGWTVAQLARPGWVPRPAGRQAPSESSPDKIRTKLGDAYEDLRTRRDQLLIQAALATPEDRRLAQPRRNVLLALEARRRGEVPSYPPEVLDQVPLPLRQELLEEDVATRVLRLADGDLRTLKAELLHGWGVENIRFGPREGLLAVQSAVDDGRTSRTEIRIYEQGLRYFQANEPFTRQGTTPYWKVLHDVARKPQTLHPDWLLEDTGPILFWRRPEILLTRPRDDRLAFWRVPQLGFFPAPSIQIQPGTIRGFPLPVQSASLSEDGIWLAAIDSAGQAYVARLAGSREPKHVELEFPPGGEPPRFQQAHVTSKQLLLLGKSGIVGYRLGRDGPILETADGTDAAVQLFGPGAGFSDIVGARDGSWMVALPALTEGERQTVVFIAFQEGIATRVEELENAVDHAWRATLSPEEQWLAVHRASETYAESVVYDLQGKLVEAGPVEIFRIPDAVTVDFGVGPQHVGFRAQGKEQVWNLTGDKQEQVQGAGLPDYNELRRSFLGADPVALAKWFLRGDPRLVDADEWLPYHQHGVLETAPYGHWYAIAGPGRLLRVWNWYYRDTKEKRDQRFVGNILVDLARFRPYPSNYPSSLDVWPEIVGRNGEPAGAELWKEACSIAGRNLSREEWEYLFGVEKWSATCSFGTN